MFEQKLRHIFLLYLQKRWSSTSTNLRYIQSLLEEVLSHWKRWNSTYPQIDTYLEEAPSRLHDASTSSTGGHNKYEYFRDISEWKNKYVSLQETVAFLVATCDQPTSQDLSIKWEELSRKWEDLMRDIEDFVAQNELSSVKAEYARNFDELANWITTSEEVLSSPQTLTLQCIEDTVHQLMGLHSEVAKMEDVFRGLSKIFQHLVEQEISNSEVEEMMTSLKTEKAKLVIIRTIIPTKLQLFHNLSIQLAAINENRAEMKVWCEKADEFVGAHTSCGSLEHFNSELQKFKSVSSNFVKMKSQYARSAH